MTTVSQALKLAVQHHKAQRFSQAQEIYSKIIEAQPDNPEALYGLGMLAHQVGKSQQAEKFLNTAVGVQPNSFKAWFSLGNVCQAHGNFPAATKAYQQAINLQPDSASIYNNLGYTLQKQGKFDEAITCYQKALEIDPNCTEADVNWGNTLHEQGKLSPENQLHYGQLNHKLGIARKDAGDWKTASIYYRQAILLLESAQRVLTIHSDLVEVHYNLGEALQALGDPEAAGSCYQKALEVDPNYGKAYMCLGQIYQIQHKLKEAALAYKEGLKLINPHYAAAVSAYQNPDFVPENYTSPELELGEVTVGDYQFPAIPPVCETEGKRPFFSVIIPLYNRKHYLLECLASVLGQWQGEEEMEIIVMDNASEPPLFDLVDAIGGGVVRYYLNSENIGPRRNFNRGIALSRGQWIHLLPEDEYVLPGFYSRLKSGLETCPDTVGAAFTGYQNIDQNRKVIFAQKHWGMERGINKNWLERIGVSNPLNPCATVIRRVAHERLGAYDLINLYTPDWELYKRIASFYDWWCEPEILACYRQHTNSMSSEVFLAGAQGEYYRLGIEISESYLPIEHRAEITRKSRRHYFNKCLSQAIIPLKAGRIEGAFSLVQEAIRIDSSPEAIAKLFTWLATDEAIPLRNAIAHKWMSNSQPNTDSNSPDRFYFAYP
ncbi:MAG: tetratricopeptide repeat protein [Nostocaceae cyanobacterium]|nr:tetratricopeptide repeat protein [Nostocaceae cyanobacterium]